MKTTKKSLIVVLPVYNEEKVLKENVLLLYSYLEKNILKYRWKILIANNGSSDRTPEIAKNLQSKYHKIESLDLDQSGRGLAIKTAWLRNKDAIMAYMDIDLSTSLNHFLSLISATDAGADIAVGSRSIAKSKVIGRTWKREILSRVYTYIVKKVLDVRISDPQCGFKVIRKETAHLLLPHIKNSNWFFDTELLVIAEKTGHSIYEEAVTWEDDTSSSVKIIRTIFEDLSGILRLLITRPWRRIPQKNLT